MRLGSTEPHQLDVRFLAATNQNVRSLISERRFRADLYYRLSMVEISLPPLREREGDVALLVDHFNRDLSDSLRLPCTPLPEDVMKALANYTWPGNVRELRNVVERSLIMAGEGAKVTLEDLPVHVANAVSVGMSFEAPALSMAAVAGQSGRMAPVGGGLPTGMYSPSAAFDRVGAGAYDRPSAMGYGYQESTPFGRLFLGRRPMASASMRWLVLGCVRPMSQASIRRVGNRGNCIRDKTRMPLFPLLQARGSLPEPRARFRKMKMWQKPIACVSSRRFEGLMAICFWRQSSWA